MALTMTCGAGSSPSEDNTNTKRHSRSLDLGNTNERIGVVRHHLHQRSASESNGIEIMMAAAATKDTKEQRPTLPSNNSVFSIYKIKKLGSPKNKSITLPEKSTSNKSPRRASIIGSAFATFRQPSINDKKNQRHSCVSTPVSNPGMS
jgi:hypothetical protein